MVERHNEIKQEFYDGWIKPGLVKAGIKGKAIICSTVGTGTKGNYAELWKNSGIEQDFKGLKRFLNRQFRLT